MTDAAAIEIPRWVMPEDHEAYRRIAETRGEEEAASFARNSKRARMTLPPDPRRAPRLRLSP